MTDTIYTLIVDDSEFFAEMTAETLANEHGMRTRDCNSVGEAKELLDTEPVDCIVSDYEMPGQDGLEFLEWVHETHDDLPFILLTGRGDEEIASEAIAGGVADYLLKLEVVEDNQYGRLANRIRSVVDQRQAEQKYQRLVESSPDAIVHIAVDGEILAANRTFTSMVDRSMDAIVGSTLDDILPENISQGRMEAGHDSIEGGASTELDDSYDNRHFHNIFVPIDGSGGRNSFQMIARDITERKEREWELRRQNERLETFASVVTHDLRNPLNVASSSLDLLEPEVGDTEGYDRIDRSLDRMDALIEDVLTLARQGESVSEVQSVSLPTLVREAWSHIDAGEATLTVETTATIEGDRQRLQQLLENLFRNAVEHVGSDVSVTVGDIDGGFYVADDGPGIDPAARDTVIEMGYSTNQTGTGMGLSIVQQVSDAHDWTLTIAQSAEDGARFEVTNVTVH